jgi:peptide/nickel transport system substrate-binding protein
VADPAAITSYFAYFPASGSQRSGWQDARLDGLFEASRSEGDGEKRAALYKEIQLIVAAAAPLVFLYEAPCPVVWRRQARGFVETGLGNTRFEAVQLGR